ncbi:MAG: hypothetical protein WAT70_09580, partial [Rhizobiaceae bacterium]
MAVWRVLVLLVPMMLAAAPAMAQIACLPGLPCPGSGATEGGKRPKFTIDIKPAPKVKEKAKPAAPKARPATSAKAVPRVSRPAAKPAAPRLA